MRLQDDEAHAFPYGSVEGHAHVGLRGFGVDVYSHIWVEEGKPYSKRSDLNPMFEVVLRDPILGDHTFDTPYLDEDFQGVQGGAEYWFSPVLGKTYMNDAIWNEQLIDDVSHAIAEREEYARVMGKTSAQRNAQSRGDSGYWADEADEMLERLDWQTIESYMDAEIAERLHMELAPCSDRTFLMRYMDEHDRQFGEPFEIN